MTFELSENSTVNISEIRNKCVDALNDDLSTPIVISCLFDVVKTINEAFKKVQKKAAQKMMESGGGLSGLLGGMQ